MTASTIFNAEAAQLNNITSQATNLASSSPALGSHPVTLDDEANTSFQPARSRPERPYTRPGPSGNEYVVINPLKSPEGMDEDSRPRVNLDYRDSPDPAATSIWSENEKGEHSTPRYGDGGLLRELDDPGIIIHEKKHRATEIVATTSARRWWLRITWALTWWVPSFCLSRVGKMHRPDIRMAWREKLAIVIMIFFLCGTVLFYIIVFGKLLCPNSAKAWNPTQLAEHAGSDDYYAAIAGKVYDVGFLTDLLPKPC